MTAADSSCPVNTVASNPAQDYFDSLTALPGPDMIRAAEQLIRGRHRPLDPDYPFWGQVARYLNSAAGIPDLTSPRPRDTREYNRATAMATAAIDWFAARRVSVTDILGRRLPCDATGVWWSDTDYTECRSCLTGLSWQTGALSHHAVPLGHVMAGPVSCDTCAERNASGCTNR